MAAEFFDDKLLSFGYTTFGVYETRNLTYDEFVNYELMVNLAQFDATIAIWKEKARWDAVRPFTAIPYLYGDQKITAYCGKGKCHIHISAVDMFCLESCFIFQQHCWFIILNTHFHILNRTRYLQ